MRQQVELEFLYDFSCHWDFEDTVVILLENPIKFETSIRLKWASFQKGGIIVVIKVSIFPS